MWRFFFFPPGQFLRYLGENLSVRWQAKGQWLCSLRKLWPAERKCTGAGGRSGGWRGLICHGGVLFPGIGRRKQSHNWLGVFGLRSQKWTRKGTVLLVMLVSSCWMTWGCGWLVLAPEVREKKTTTSFTSFIYHRQVDDHVNACWDDSLCSSSDKGCTSLFGFFPLCDALILDDVDRTWSFVDDYFFPKCCVKLPAAQNNRLSLFIKINP